MLGAHRRSLSAAFIRTQMACFTSRMGHLGVGSREAAAKRAVAMAEEQRIQREDEAHFLRHVGGRHNVGVA